MDKERDSYYMSLALQQARLAMKLKEVPIGAVLVYDDKVIASSHNRRILDSDPTAHAEILALREGGKNIGRWNLTGCTLYVTLEPCPMCAGAIVNARIARLCYGAKDLRFGGVDSVYNICNQGLLNHTVSVDSGILQDECSRLLSEFFKDIRTKN